MNLVQVLVLALALTALAVVLFLRFLRLGQILYLYGTIALGFLGGIFFGVILRLHDFLGSWSADPFLDIVLVIFVVYALSLCYEEIRYHRQHDPLALPAATPPEASRASLARHSHQQTDT